MILAYEGTPGSGKSYEAMKAIIDNIKRGRKVYTNIDGVEDADCREGVRLLCDLESWDLSTMYIGLSPEDIVNIPRMGASNCIFVIDEAHEFFSNRDWDSQKNKDFVKWAKSHRHSGIDVIIISTEIEGLDKQLRGLCQWTYQFAKMDYFGSAVKNKYDVAVYRGSVVAGKPFKKFFRVYDKKVFITYKSYVTDEVKELKLHKAVNILRHPVFYVLPVILIFAIYMASKSSIFGHGMIGGVQSIVEKSKNAVVKPKVDNKLQNPVVVEFRDLIVKNEKIKSSMVVDGGTPAAGVQPLASAVVVKDIRDNAVGDKCKKTGRVEFAGDVIELSECNGQSYHKLNGVTDRESRIRSPESRYNGGLKSFISSSSGTDFLKPMQGSPGRNKNKGGEE
jgi:hypothetical protein